MECGPFFQFFFVMFITGAYKQEWQTNKWFVPLQLKNLKQTMLWPPVLHSISKCVKGIICIIYIKCIICIIFIFSLLPGERWNKSSHANIEPSRFSNQWLKWVIWRMWSLVIKKCNTMTDLIHSSKRPSLPASCSLPADPWLGDLLLSCSPLRASLSQREDHNFRSVHKFYS